MTRNASVVLASLGLHGRASGLIIFNSPTHNRTPISKAMIGWSATTGLNHYLFESINEVQNYAPDWTWTYNHERPNMALGGITPKKKSALLTHFTSDCC